MNLKEKLTEKWYALKNKDKIAVVVSVISGVLFGITAAIMLTPHSSELTIFSLSCLITGLIGFCVVMFISAKEETKTEQYKHMWRMLGIICITSVIVGGIGYLLGSLFGGAGSGGGCSICGDEIFAGQFCEEHFNEWANSTK